MNARTLVNVCLGVASGQVLPHPPEHPFNEFLLVERGRHRLRHAGGTWQGDFGDWICLPAGHPHQPRYHRDGRLHLWVLQWTGPGIAGGVHCGHDAAGRLRFLVQWLDGIPGPRPPAAGGPPARMQHIFELLLDELIAPSADPTDPIERLRDHLEQDLGGHHSAESLARWVGMAPRTLHRRFLDRYGIPPMTWLRQARLDHAYRLLTTSQLPSEEICRRIGMESPRHLARQVRRRFGVTVRELRGS